MPASSPDRGRRPQVRGGSFPDPASAPEGPSGIRSSGLKPSQISHRRVFALRRTSVLFCSKNSNSANPDAQERLSQAPAFPFGCFQDLCACGAGTEEVLACGKQQKGEYVTRVGRRTPESDSRRTRARNAGDQEPASHHAAQ